MPSPRAQRRDSQRHRFEIHRAQRFPHAGERHDTGASHDVSSATRVECPRHLDVLIDPQLPHQAEQRRPLGPVTDDDQPGIEDLGPEPSEYPDEPVNLLARDQPGNGADGEVLRWDRGNSCTALDTDGDNFAAMRTGQADPLAAERLGYVHRAMGPPQGPYDRRAQGRVVRGQVVELMIVERDHEDGTTGLSLQPAGERHRVRQNHVRRSWPGAKCRQGRPGEESPLETRDVRYARVPRMGHRHGSVAFFIGDRNAGQPAPG